MFPALPSKSSVRGWRERSTNDDIRTDFFLFLFFFLSFFGLFVLYTIYPFFIFPFFGEFRPVIVIDDDEWDIFFLSISTEVTPQSGDPTSGVYEQPTNTHCFALGCGVVFDDGRTQLRPTRHKGIMEKYPPFPKRGLIYLSSFFVFVFVIFVIIIISERMHVGSMMIPRLMEKRISSIRNGSLISKVCQVVFSLMSKMRRIHGYIVASPFVLAREERER